MSLKDYLNTLDKKDQERTKGYLDLLSSNIENNLLGVLNNNSQIVIELDHVKKEVSLLWDKIPVKKWSFLTSTESSQQDLYNNFIEILEIIKKDSIENKVIQEIYPQNT